MRDVPDYATAEFLRGAREREATAAELRRRNRQRSPEEGIVGEEVIEETQEPFEEIIDVPPRVTTPPAPPPARPRREKPKPKPVTEPAKPAPTPIPEKADRPEGGVSETIDWGDDIFGSVRKTVLNLVKLSERYDREGRHVEAEAIHQILRNHILRS